MSRLIHWSLASMMVLGLTLTIGCGGKDKEKAAEDDGGGSSGIGESGGRGGDGVGGAAISLNGGPGQDGRLDAGSSSKAVVAIEFNLDRLMSSPLLEDFPIEEALQDIPGAQGEEMATAMAAKRMVIYVSAPASMQEVMGMMNAFAPPEKLPFEAFSEIEFRDPAFAADMIEETKLAMREVSRNGRTFYAPPEGQGPEVYLEIASDTIIRGGTPAFLDSDPSSFISDGLRSQWAAMPEAAVRIAIDLDGARGLIDEALAQFGETVPPWAKPWLDAVHKTQQLTLAFDVQSDSMLNVNFATASAEDAEAVKTVVAAIAALGQMQMASQISQIKQNDPEAGAMAQAMMKSLTPTVEGNQVVINVVKPEGFEEMVMKAMSAAQGAANETVELNNFKMIAIGVHNYHDVYNRLPTVPVPDFNSADLSWRVRILPYIEELPLHDRFDLAKAWDDPVNAPMASEVPKVYGDGGETTNVVFIKTEPQAQNFGAITDGLSNTIMLMETLNPVPWTQAADITVDEAVAMVTSLPDGETLIFARYDGSVDRIDNTVSEEDLRNLLEPANGQ